jgi:hypothetical protein
MAHGNVADDSEFETLKSDALIKFEYFKKMEVGYIASVPGLLCGTDVNL